MGFLDDLRKKTLDIASRAYDEVNQFDGGKNWNQRTVTVKGRGAPSGARYLADMTAGNTARLVNTANAGVVQPIVGGLQGKSARQLSREFDRNVYTDRGGLLNVGTFFPTVQDFERNFKDPASFAKGFTAAGVGTATEVAPMVRGASLLMKPGLKGSEKVIRGAAEGAVYGGAGTAAQQQLYNGELDAKGIATGAAFGAGLGGGIPAAGIAGKAGAKTTQHAARIGWERSLENVAKNADTVDLNPNIVPAPTKQLDSQRVLAYANKIANGDDIKPVVTSRGKDGSFKILDGEHRAEAYKQLGIPVPTKTITGREVQDAWVRANSFTKQNLVPGGTLGGPLGRDFADFKKKGMVFDGVDGKPRYEIDDSGAKLNPAFINKSLNAPGIDKMKIRYGTTISEVLDHPKLFKQYPDLKNVRVGVLPDYSSVVGGGTKAMFDPERGTIFLNTVGDPKEIKSTIIHELQHAIQEKEAFAKGGNLDAGGMDAYRHLAGEAEARAVQARMNMKPEERYVTPDSSFYHGTNQQFMNFDTKMINSIEKDGDYIGKGFFFTKSKNQADRYAKQAVNKKGGAKTIIGAELDMKNPLVINSEKDADALRESFGGLIEYFDIMKKDPSIIANELKRRGYDGLVDNTYDQVAVFSPSQIKVAKPRSTFYDSLDVPKEDLIIRNGDGKAMSIDNKAKKLQQEMEKEVDFEDPSNYYTQEQMRQMAKDEQKWLEIEGTLQKNIDKSDAELAKMTGLTEQDVAEYRIETAEAQKSTEEMHKLFEKNSLDEDKIAQKKIPSIVKGIEEKLNTDTTKLSARAKSKLSDEYNSLQGELMRVMDDLRGTGETVRLNGEEYGVKGKVKIKGEEYAYLDGDGEADRAFVKMSALETIGKSKPAPKLPLDPKTETPAIKPIAKPPVTPPTPPKKPLPTAKASEQKLSRFANRTVQNSDEVSTPLKKLVREEKVSYGPHTNEGRLAASEAWLKGKSTDKAFSESIDKLATGKMNDQDVVNAISIAKKLDGSGSEDDLIKATEIYGQLSEHLTKRGQEVQAASLLSNRTPEGLRYGAQRDLQKGLKEKGKDITPEQINEIKRLVDDIKQFDPKSDDAAFARHNLAKYVSSQIPSGTAGKIINFWRAGLLTGPTTTGGNILGNTGEAAVRKIWVNPATELADAAMSAFTGKRTFSANGGFAKGAKDGAGKLGRFMKTGYDERNALSKYDTKELNYGDSLAGKLTGGYVNGVYRTMSLADQPFWYGARNESLKGLANVEAMNKGLKGADKNAFVEQFMKNPPKAAMEQATKDAKYATFQNETALGTAASSLKMGLRQKSDTAGAVSDFLIPFTQVPASIATRVIQRTPVGTAAEIVKQYVNVKNGKAFDQRAMAKAIGEGSFGMAALGAGFALANSGALTFGFPEDPQERELWEAEGKQPYSVRVGDRWYSLNYLQPFGTLLSVGGDMANSVKEGADPVEATSRGLGTAGQAIMNQSFLKGISGVLDAIDDPKRYAENYVSNTAGSTVPNFVRSFARAADPLQREQKGAAEGIQGAIPGLRQGLPAKQDMFGRDVTAKDNFANQYLNPLRPSKVKNSNDVAIKELRRLHDGDNSILPSAAKKNVFGKETELTRPQLRELNGLTGQAMKSEYDKLIDSAAYKKLSDEEKKASIKKINDTVYGAVKNEYGQKLGLASADDLTKNQKRYLQGTQVDFIARKNADGTTASVDINPKLAKTFKDTLSAYETMTTEEREAKFNKENDAEFKYLAAKYENDKASGAINEVEDVKRRKALAKAEAGSKVSKMTRDLYGMSKADINDFVTNHKDGERLAKELMEYDRLLLNGGLVAYAKFKNGIAPSSRTARGGSRKKSGGRTAKASKGNAADAKVGDRSDAISTTSAVSRRVANAKVSGKIQLTASGRIRRPGIKAYKKADQTKVTVKRNIT